MKLKDIPLNDLKIGMRLRSHQDTLGTLVGFDWYDRDPPSIIIVWDNGSESRWWPQLLDIEVIDPRSALERAGDKLNLGLDQVGELAIQIYKHKPCCAVGVRSILNRLFGEDISCRLPSEDLEAVAKEFQEYTGRCPLK